MRRQQLLSRYEHSPEGEVFIDVSARRVEDLFNYFDRAAAFRKKDLDQDFVDYLIECVREIKGAPFIIRIILQSDEEMERLDRTRRAIKNFFKYLKDVEYAESKRLVRRSLLYFLLGLTLLSLSLAGGALIGPRVFGNLLSEGLTIAAWVSMWQAFAQLIFDLPPHFHNIRIYKRIMWAQVIFAETTPVVDVV